MTARIWKPMLRYRPISLASWLTLIAIRSNCKRANYRFTKSNIFYSIPSRFQFSIIQTFRNRNCSNWDKNSPIFYHSRRRRVEGKGTWKRWFNRWSILSSTPSTGVETLSAGVSYLRDSSLANRQRHGCSNRDRNDGTSDLVPAVSRSTRSIPVIHLHADEPVPRIVSLRVPPLARRLRFPTETRKFVR